MPLGGLQQILTGEMHISARPRRSETQFTWPPARLSKEVPEIIGNALAGNEADGICAKQCDLREVLNRIILRAREDKRIERMGRSTAKE